MKKATVVLTAVLVGVGTVGVGAAYAQNAGLQPVAASPVTFRLASSSPQRGFEAVNLANRTLYVAPRAILSGTDVMSAASFDSRIGSDLDLALTRDGADRMAEALRIQDADQLAIYVNDQLVSAGSLTLQSLEGRAVISGLTQIQADRLTRALGDGISNRSGAVVSLVTSTQSIQAGDAVVVDVFARGVSDLRSYQVRLDVSGGTGGRLEVEDLRVDGERADHVFSGLQKFDAVDRTGGRLGAVLLNGGVDVVDQVYLGSYTLRASSDAQGTFSVSVATANRASLLWSSRNQSLGFAAPGIQIAVGKALLKRPARRR